MFDAQQFYSDYEIQFWTEGENVQSGWVNIQCPFCDDHSNHGGWNQQKGYYNCWKCGWHPTSELVKIKLNISKHEAVKIISKYESFAVQLKKEKRKGGAEKIILPYGAEALKSIHKEYLRKRNYNPEEIEKQWGILGTNHLGEYKFRIIIPIFINNKIVSWQSRDITGLANLRYITCRPEDEIIFHKYIVYGIDQIRNRRAIIVEGVPGVWRIGAGAVATFGTSFTDQQVLFISKHIDEAYILFDAEAQAQGKALELASRLSVLGVNAAVLEDALPDLSDPGDLSENRVKKIRKILNFD